MTDYQNELVMEHLDLVNWVIRTRISVPNRPLRVLSVRVSLSIRPKLSKLFFRCCGNKVGASLSSIV